MAFQGSNGSGQFGDGLTATSDAIPNDVLTAMDASSYLSGVTLMAAGSSFMCVKRAGNEVTCWGNNSGDVLGATGPNRLFCDLALPVPGLP